ncbi:MAG TPA: RbsD/FucU domain-containing protein [Phycisphaerae bacterium]|nr:RbsD/FucU domain-containing protein [Phycisphaerae bacterium]
MSDCDCHDPDCGAGPTRRRFPAMAGMAAAALAVAGCQAGAWRQQLSDELPVLGHRNWIVIADSAYPAQSRAGIETLYTGADQAAVVKAVLAAVDASPHVRPVVYLDAELPLVSDKDAPGIAAYRKELAAVLGQRPINSLPHEEIIAKLDKAGEVFRVLILKTNMALPYTSVFLELNCGYWTAEAEQRLRDAIQAAK